MYVFENDKNFSQYGCLVISTSQMHNEILFLANRFHDKKKKKKKKKSIFKAVYKKRQLPW